MKRSTAQRALLNFFLLAGSGFIAHGQSFQVTVQQSSWRNVERVLEWPKPTLLWRGEPLVAPRGVRLFNNMLFIGDPADVKGANKFARIVKFELANGVPQNPIIFFMRPGFLWSAKWAVPYTSSDGSYLIIADQGQSLPDGSFSGLGAKVFLLPILDSGIAGEPRVLWEGPPFVSPTGVVVINDYIIVTDPSAGPIITRPERPDRAFPSSAIFALHITGGEAPVLLQEGAPYISLIGICPAVPGQLIFTDTDSGLLTSGAGRPGFSPDATADRWVVRILDPSSSPPLLSAPVRTPFTEDGPLRLKFSNVPTGAAISIRRSADTLIINPADSARATNEIIVSPDMLNADGEITIGLRSSMIAPAVSISARMIAAGRVLSVLSLTLNKDADAQRPLMNNKHGGARPVPPQNYIYNYFTTDSSLEHPVVSIYSHGGGTPVVIAQGDPLVRPLSGQLSDDTSTLWIADQGNASLFSLPFPDPEVFESLFPSSP